MSDEAAPVDLVYVAVAPYAWGSGETRAQAVARCRKAWPNFARRPHMPYTLYIATPDFEVDQHGGIAATNVTRLRVITYDDKGKRTTREG